MFSASAGVAVRGRVGGALALRQLPAADAGHRPQRLCRRRARRQQSRCARARGLCAPREHVPAGLDSRTCQLEIRRSACGMRWALACQHKAAAWRLMGAAGTCCFRRGRHRQAVLPAVAGAALCCGAQPRAVPVHAAAGGRSARHVHAGGAAAAAADRRSDGCRCGQECWSGREPAPAAASAWHHAGVWHSSCCAAACHKAGGVAGSLLLTARQWCLCAGLPGHDALPLRRPPAAAAADGHAHAAAGCSRSRRHVCRRRSLLRVCRSGLVAAILLTCSHDTIICKPVSGA